MKVSGLAKYALTITTGAAMLTACSNSGGSALAPSGASSGMPGIAHIGRPVMVRKGIGPFQYIANFGSGSVGNSILEFDYPKSDASIGSISVTAPRGECTNVLFGTGKGTFWVTSSSGLYEFKVGDANPIRVLLSAQTVGCAIDPATGDLATTSQSNSVFIFRHARGKGKLYLSPLRITLYDGYDSSGNLFVDGFSSGSTFGFVELPKGSKSWKTLSGASVGFPGAVQFDGKYITVTDTELDFNHIFGYTCSGTTCTLKRTVSLTDASDCDQTWIAKGYVICPDDNNAAIYPYPKGGAALHQLSGSFSGPDGAVQVEK
jgi:hypothetical protein